MSSTDKLTDFAIDKMQHFFDSLNAAMPKITHAVLTVTQYDCAFNILTGLFLLIVSAIGIKAALYFWGKYQPDEYSAYDFWAIATFIPSSVALVNSFVFLLDFWSWVGMFHPDLYLIHVALSKVTG
jgi:hypothetical protein